MSIQSTNSGDPVPKQPPVEKSDFNENHWQNTGDARSEPESPIWSPDPQNATFIRYDKDCQKGSDKWKRFKWLSEHNTGLRNAKWTNQGYNTHLLNEHLIWALITQLDLNPRYQQKVESLFLSFDLRKFGVNAGIVAYCTCAVVIHEAENHTRECHPSVKDMDPEFERIAECEGYGEKELISIYNKISQSPEKFQG